MLVVLCDKLLKTGIVECAAVANWVFSKDMVPEFSKCYLWEIVHITIRKMNKHVAKLSIEATNARRLIEDSDSESSDSDDEGGVKQRRRQRPLERPTEESVEKLEERLEAAQADQKNLFLIIFQRFIMILSEHLVRCDTDAVDFKSPWYLWTLGRLHQIFMLHHEQVERYSSTLETLLFTQDLDPNILDVFHQFVALRM
jgi:nuclear cap-binding protein subunit 1